MANYLISGLPDGAVAELTDLIEIERGTAPTNESLSLTLQMLKDLIAPAVVSGINIVDTAPSNVTTPAGDTDIIRLQNLAAPLTIANPSSGPVDGWSMVIELRDDGTPRALTWGSYYANRIANLPATTVAGKFHKISVEWLDGDTKYYCDVANVQP
jgi:hypothetical protein